MFSDSSEVLKFIKDTDVKFLDIRFTDLPGVQQHFNIPASTVDEEFFTVGQLFDGSSIRGFANIHESDMQLIPDVSTAYLDPFRDAKTLIMVFDIYNPRNGEIYSKDPRQVAKKAEKYLASTGIADTAFFAPEAEFYIFDDVRFEVKQNSSFYSVDSEEGAWNTGRVEEGGNLANKTPYKGGYFPVSPVDKQADLRDDISLKLIEAGLILERAHHEVGTGGQAEINYRFDTMVHAADDILKFKYIVKNTAEQWGKTATFMPKPLFGDNGSGMHTHQSLWNDGKPLFYDESGYGGLSDIARWYIGGILAHAPARARLHEPDAQQLPPPGAGLRGSGQPGLLGRQPLGGDPHPDHGHEPEGQAHRVPRAGCLGQPVPRVRRAADGRPRRHQEPHRAARARRQGPLRAAARGGQEHPAGAELAGGVARRARGRPRVPRSRATCSRTELIETWIDYKRENEIKPARAAPAPVRVRAVLRRLARYQGSRGISPQRVRTSSQHSTNGSRVRTRLCPATGGCRCRASSWPSHASTGLHDLHVKPRGDQQRGVVVP